MALVTLTFPPGTVAFISKSGGSTWTVDSVNTTEVTLVVDDTNNDGFISNAEWDAAIGGGGNDTGDDNYLFDGSGSSGTLYSVDGVTTFTVGQNVSATKNNLTNNFDSDVGPVICLTTGTRVLKPDGWTQIEDIQVGDQIVTENDHVETVRWIGRRKLDQSELKLNPKLFPVVISQGTLGAGLPTQDLRVSRQHRMMVQSKIAERMFGRPEVLISAIKLTALPGVFVDETVDEIEYVHVLFDKHEIIFAEGAPTESLYTGPEALKSVGDEAREEILSLFPELADHQYAPEPAKYIPSGKHQRQLVARHTKNRKPLLS